MKKSKKISIALISTIGALATVGGSLAAVSMATQNNNANTSISLDGAKSSSTTSQTRYTLTSKSSNVTFGNFGDRSMIVKPNQMVKVNLKDGRTTTIANLTIIPQSSGKFSVSIAESKGSTFNTTIFNKIYSNVSVKVSSTTKVEYRLESQDSSFIFNGKTKTIHRQIEGKEVKLRATIKTTTHSSKYGYTITTTNVYDGYVKVVDGDLILRGFPSGAEATIKNNIKVTRIS